jgi:hypothetical protein
MAAYHANYCLPTGRMASDKKNPDDVRDEKKFFSHVPDGPDPKLHR